MWALGDCTAVPNAATPGRTDPPTCQHALRQARRLAKNLEGDPEPYAYRMLGQVATLGRYKGIADVLGVRIRGFPGLVRHPDVPPLPAAARVAQAAGRHGLDDVALLPPRHRGAVGPGSRSQPGRAIAAFAVQGLEKRYGTIAALRGIDLEVAEGELFGLLGPNGAGKSTLVKIGCGLVRPSAGAASVCGSPAGSRAARTAMGYLAELFRFPGWCTADEVLSLHQRLAGSRGGGSERHELLELVGLAEARRRKVEAMSKGMQQRLGLAQALIGSPRMLFLDEPTSALDPAGRRSVRGLLESLRDRGIAVLLNSHLLSEVELVCDRVAILLDGRIVAAGRPDDLMRARGVEVETSAGTRLIEGASREDVPRLVAELVAAGEAVYGVRVLRSTLEDVYLDAVGEEQ